MFEGIGSRWYVVGGSEYHRLEVLVPLPCLGSISMGGMNGKPISLGSMGSPSGTTNPTWGWIEEVGQPDVGVGDGGGSYSWVNLKRYHNLQSVECHQL